MHRPSRQHILQHVAKRILSVHNNRPVRVGIDGITASGKSTFAKELSDILSQANQSIIHTTLDGFHNPRTVRYARGRNSAEGYYYDAYNYSAIIENLLKPLGPDGDLEYKTKVFDLELDQLILFAPIKAEKNSILIVDGSFSLRPELRDHWDFKVFLSVDFDIAEERASKRDAETFGSATEARQVTKTRYHGAHRIHSESCKPQSVADVIIQNNDPLHPHIEFERF